MCCDWSSTLEHAGEYNIPRHIAGFGADSQRESWVRQEGGGEKDRREKGAREGIRNAQRGWEKKNAFGSGEKERGRMGGLPRLAPSSQKF